MFKYAPKQFQEGIELHKSGFLEEAAYKYISLLNSTNSLSENLSVSPQNSDDAYLDFRIAKYKVYANLNLASIRFQQYRYDEAIHYYVEGLKFAPTNFGAHVDLAKAYEMTGQWNEAIFHINESLKIFPNHATALRRKARILEEKHFYESLRKKFQFAMKNYKVNARHITIQSDYEIDRSVCESVESLMERVYLELNEEFDFHPKDPVKIILFYDKAFYAGSMSFPRWAVGMYDGSIKILLRATDEIHLGLMYVLLRHEYMHQIVDELSNGKCPRWFNEGLSEYKARGMFDFERNTLQKAIAKNQQIPLDQLDDKFMTPKNKMRLAYIQACSIVEFIIEELGMIGVRKLLNRIGSSRDNSDEVIYKLLGITSEQLQTIWLKSKYVLRSPMEL